MKLGNPIDKKTVATDVATAVGVGTGLVASEAIDKVPFIADQSSLIKDGAVGLVLLAGGMSLKGKDALSTGARTAAITTGAVKCVKAIKELISPTATGQNGWLSKVLGMNNAAQVQRMDPRQMQLPVGQTRVQQDIFQNARVAM